MDALFNISRRGFVGLGLSALACACLAPSPAFAVARRPASKARVLALYNLHTDEKLRVTFYKEGAYDKLAMAKINKILRDHRSGIIKPINTRLINLLSDLQADINPDAAMEIISGYRAPQTNAVMREASNGVAKNSFHTKAMATDIRLPGVSLSKLRHVALNMGRGGVGFYPTDGFVHVDVGPVRQWG